MAYVDFIIPGYDWNPPEFQIRTDGVPTDITGWELTAEFFWRGRNSSARLDPSNVLLSLTSGTSCFSIVSEALGKFRFDLTATQTDDFVASPDQIPGPAQKMAIRISRTDSGMKKFLADATVNVRF